MGGKSGPELIDFCPLSDIDSMILFPAIPLNLLGLKPGSGLFVLNPDSSDPVSVKL